MDQPLTSKLSELHLALLLAAIVSKHRGEEYWIAFPVKESKRKEYTLAGGDADLQELLAKFGEEDPPQDVFLVPESEFSKTNKKRLGAHGYQLKRLFSDDPKIPLEDIAINFLNNVIPAQYAKAIHTELVLFPTSKVHGGTVNIRKIKNGLKIDAFPFDRILFLTIENEHKITFCEIWPNFGNTSYSQKELI